MIKMVNKLGATKLFSLTMSFGRVPLSFSRPTARLYGDGAVIVGKMTMEPRRFNVAGTIYYQNMDLVPKELDSILEFLTHPPIQVYKDHSIERYLVAHPLGAPQDWVDLGAEIVVDIPMAAADPYWYGEEITKTASGAGSVALSVENKGTAPTCPTIDVVAGGNIAIENTTSGQSVAVSSSAGDIIRIDCAKMQVTINGELALGSVNDGWLLNSLSLWPGENNLALTGAGENTITITYRPKWY